MANKVTIFYERHIIVDCSQVAESVIYKPFMMVSFTDYADDLLLRSHMPR